MNTHYRPTSSNTNPKTYGRYHWGDNNQDTTLNKIPTAQMSNSLLYKHLWDSEEITGSQITMSLLKLES